MAGTPATVLLDARGARYQVRTYPHRGGTGYGLEAARELGLDPHQVFKTLVADVEGAGLAVGVLPASDTLDLEALAAALGAKRAKMARSGRPNERPTMWRAGFHRSARSGGYPPSSTSRRYGSRPCSAAAVAEDCRSSWVRTT